VSRVVPTTTPSGDPLDLSMAVTRAVSPIHLQYLRNMEVRASMSSSILREGELWGLIACHHDTPRHIDFQTRSALELFTQLLAYELAHRQDRNEMKEAEKAHLLHDRLVMMFEGGMDLGNSLRLLGEEIGEVIPFDGIASFSGDRYRCEGLTPTAEELDVLRKHLARMPSNRAYSTGFVEKAFPGAIAPDRGIGGMMALPIKREPREYVLLFRQEIVHSVNWAGDPSKPAQVVDGRLTPRESFAIWKEEVRGKSAPWTAGEKRSGEILRVTLLELMLKMTTQVATRGRQRSDKQEILIAELNHRLRNIFTVMGGMVRQASATDGESLRQSLSRRIETLARANDALIAGGAETASLRGLIADEIGAFDSGSRLRVEGQDAQISGPARGTLALVIHELVTNSFKYGALSVPEGQIVLALSNGPNGSLIWTWKERGGPKVEEPSRTGFGTTLISRAIPHELRGEAEIAFKPGGVEARFVLPATAAKMSSFAPSLKVVETMPDDANLLKDQEVLVVDDNFVIAMNASDALERLGPRKVHLAGGVEEGLKLLKAQTVDFAVLDIDLGGESSEPIAQRLTEMGVPFILASGYSAKDDLGASFTGHPVLTKPYSNENLASAIKAMRLNS
jgi:light-regulated signal transduction histidine kinase (bacteriophytochrome)/CheY-like chemotaxis protein